jgi:hypothetical protein
MKRSLIFVERTLGVCWQRIEDTCSNDARSLGLFRIFWGAYVLLFYAPYSAWTSQVPQSFYSPPVLSPAFLFPGFPPYGVMLAMDLVRIWLVVLITIGIRTRVCTIVLCLLTFISLNFVYSFGMVVHDILVWVVALCLAFTDWGVPYALVPDRRVNPKVAARALATAGVLIAFGMFTSGAVKALHWINFDFSTSGFANWFYRPYFTLDRTFLLAPIVLKIPPESFKILDYIAVVFEVSAFFFLFAGRIGWRIWLLIAAIFHLANLLLLNIDFYFQALVYLPFVALVRFFGKSKDRDSANIPVFTWQVPVSVFTVILGAAHTAQRLRGQGGEFLFSAGPSDLSPLVLYGSLALLVCCTIVIAVDLLSCVSRTRLQRAELRGDDFQSLIEGQVGQPEDESGVKP